MTQHITFKDAHADIFTFDQGKDVKEYNLIPHLHEYYLGFQVLHVMKFHQGMRIV